MALVKVKPTSPGRRGVLKVVTPDLYRGKPHAPLLESQSKHAGRNNNGHITTRHQGGGHKQHYRMIDFRRNKDGIPAKVEHIEYDPNRTAHIALLCYADGERRYIIAPRGIAAGAQLISGQKRRLKWVMHCRYVIFQWVARFTALNCNQVKVRKLHAQRARQCSC